MVKLRPAKLDDMHNIVQLHIDTWQKSFRNFLPNSFLDNLNLKEDSLLKRRTNFFKNGIKHYLAENDKKELLGFSDHGKVRFEQMKSEIELYSIYVNLNVAKNV